MSLSCLFLFSMSNILCSSNMIKQVNGWNKICFVVVVSNLQHSICLSLFYLQCFSLGPTSEFTFYHFWHICFFTYLKKIYRSFLISMWNPRLYKNPVKKRDDMVWQSLKASRFYFKGWRACLLCQICFSFLEFPVHSTYLKVCDLDSTIGKLLSRWGYSRGRFQRR